MGLFSKKYDYEMDSLRYEFDLEEDKYCFFKNGKKLQDKEVTGKSRRFLKNKNKMTEEQREQKREFAKVIKKQDEERAKMKAAIDKRREIGIDLRYTAFEINSTSEPKFSKEVKDYLEDLTDEEKNTEYVVGIHRIGSSDDHLESIFNEGIRVQGHMMGAAKGTPELGNTVGYYPNNKTIMKEVGFANEYKASRGSIVVKIPKEDIISNNLYVTDEDGKYMYLNPKYIVGYFPVEEDKTVEKIVTKDTLKQYREEREQEAKEYINMGDKVSTYPPPEME